MLRSMERASPGLYTLLYHHVPAASAAQFERQLQFLKRFGPFISADQAVDRLASGWKGAERAFLLTFDDGLADTVDVALPILRRQDIPAIQFIVSDWVDAPPCSGRIDGYMTRHDIRAWLDAGLEIGSHTTSHPRLAQLDTDPVRSEFLRSRAVLSELTGRPITHFACPWGRAAVDFNPARDPALARDCGYTTFFTTRRGTASQATDLLTMPRHVIEPQWSTHALQALLGGWNHAGV